MGEPEQKKMNLSAEPGSYTSTFFDNAIRSEVSSALVNTKANVCPFAMRLAWHASGTFDKDDTSEKRGGSDGATMRFEPEISDDANAGLAIMQDLLKPVKHKFPDLSYADIWTLAGTQGLKLCGGPDVKFNYGRTDLADNSGCPANGRLPDAALGAQHLRDVFHRMGFNDKDIVTLSGAHTLGSCHEGRSGFDGPWTTNPLKFDNEYYKNLLDLEWKKREWDGPEQFQDPSGKLMMLPTDIALINDPEFLPHVKAYAADEKLFAADFADVFGRLLALGCPEKCQPDALKQEDTEPSADRVFRELAMHGSLERMKDITDANPNAKEPFSQRTPMHKAAYFGHAHVVEYLAKECKGDVNAKDCDGDTPLHDAVKFGHSKVVGVLLAEGADKISKNERGQTPMDVAVKYEKKDMEQLLA